MLYMCNVSRFCKHSLFYRSAYAEQIISIKTQTAIATGIAINRLVFSVRLKYRQTKSKYVIHR